MILFSELQQQHSDLNYNELQLMLHANCEHYISVLGGNAVLASYFSGTNVIFALVGKETKNPAEYGSFYHHFSPHDHPTIQRVSSYEDLLKFVSQKYIVTAVSS